MDEKFSAYVEAVEKHRNKIEKAIRLLIGVVPSKDAWIRVKLLDLCSAESFFSL